MEETTSDEARVIDHTADSDSDTEPMTDTEQSVTRYLYVEDNDPRVKIEADFRK